MAPPSEGCDYESYEQPALNRTQAAASATLPKASPRMTFQIVNELTDSQPARARLPCNIIDALLDRNIAPIWQVVTIVHEDKVFSLPNRTSRKCFFSNRVDSQTESLEAWYGKRGT